MRGRDGCWQWIRAASAVGLTCAAAARALGATSAATLDARGALASLEAALEDVPPKVASEAALSALHRCFEAQVRHHHRPHPMASAGAGGGRHAAGAPGAGTGASVVPDPAPDGAQTGTAAPSAGRAAGSAPANWPWPWSSADVGAAAAAPDGVDGRIVRPVGPQRPARAEHAPLGPAAQLYFFDQLADSERELGAPARLLWCRPWFSAPYLRAHHTLTRRSRVARPVPHPEAAPRRLHHFDHHNDATRVLRAAAHAGGHHPTAEHARAAVEALAAHGGGPTPLDADWLASTTSLPDLYLYEAPHAHAFTPDTGGPVGLAQAERARARFVDHVRHTLARAHDAEGTGDHAQALLFVGVAAHALLDLAWHRGMTEAEHAALTYVRHAAPDAGLAPERQAQAERALQDLFARVWPAGPNAQVRWADQEASPPRSHALAQAMARLFPHAREVDYATLLRRYQAGHALVAAGRGGATPGGLFETEAGRWDVAATLREIWREDAELG